MSRILKSLSRSYSTTSPRLYVDVVQGLYISSLKSYKPKAVPSETAAEVKEWSMPSAPTAPKYDVDFTSALNSYKYEGETIPTKAAGESNKFDFLESYENEKEH
ncbi:ATP synthase subunit H, mitochondrial [Schizosaccharomyces pombe]|uniref:ATP synthase subunit H, mitochondrial n=1 Tax=Schizosaccharomyces pombe (strain 972 / ATCC 24843) TaxID=284812 RepID=ATP14_SCHPO|nr:putative F1-ATPase subunit H [Schizosaccharomyces pombe]O59673.1 RecName: Full=ATP synthase subunit H, mitochondrial; Flags: Precursor [Schizosaccharomyces pombe 972h-]CAA18387.1 F1-ATPase subunit H (predicted) [Schizosaccharomyces pombe]|eukprot:NP_595838.1 putative F1-ATPase subunit H [Schizosaccharomyces pombe]